MERQLPKFLIFIMGVVLFLAGPINGQAESNKATAAPNLKKIYLTFDADMTPSMKKQVDIGKVKLWYDPAIIEYLEKEKVSATIFSTGMFAEMYSNVIKDWAKSGNFQIENHTYDHKAYSAPCYKLDTAKTKEEKILEITKTQEIILNLTGRKPKYFRFPGLCHAIEDDKLVESQGLKISGSDDISGDAFSKNTEAVYSSVLKHAKDGSVVLMHLGGPHAPKTLEALKKAVPELQKRGYTFELLP